MHLSIEIISELRECPQWLRTSLAAAVLLRARLFRRFDICSGACYTFISLLVGFWDVFGAGTFRGSFWGKHIHKSSRIINFARKKKIFFVKSWIRHSIVKYRIYMGKKNITSKKVWTIVAKFCILYKSKVLETYK